MKIYLSSRCHQTLTLAALAVIGGCSESSGQPSTSAFGGAYARGGSGSNSTAQSNPTGGGNLNSSGNLGGATRGGTTTALIGSVIGAGGSTVSNTQPAMGGISTGGGAVGGAPSSTSASTGTATGGAVSSAGGAPTIGGSATGGTGKGGNASGGARTGGTSALGGSSSSGAVGNGGATNASGGSSTSGTPSSGCSVTNAATGTSIDGTMTVGGTARTYRLSVPTDYKPGEALPLIFVFNGVGGTGPQAQQFFQLESGHRAIFMYPTALPNSEAGGSIAWDFKVNGVDVPYFDAMVTFLTQNYCIDTNKIFALGASSGGIMSNMLGCFRGDVLRAIAPSSGMTWQQSGCKGDVAVMVICGAQDTYNACDDAKNGGVSQTNVWVPQNGCTTQTGASPLSSICNSYQGCKAADPVLLCKHPGGHGWPTTNGDFWWQFFMGLS